ncbi:hypothetical protein APX70_200538 [Pseudomonas syringae pv. maculicola]|uniref:Uncharacterized protein n=1 Tax=Pseudomonas syringae pv. maculicola TaxID=59511 RepID=A0A3M2ZZ78_PSEYM|nr:hypothetical protein APX70_200538 [Pseudomonas syringae pv. maculicola]
MPAGVMKRTNLTVCAANDSDRVIANLQGQILT